MKIAIVCYPTFGGSGVVATELGTALAKRGHEIHFVTYKQPVRLELLSQKVFFHEVTVPEYPLFHFQPYDLALSSKLVDVVLEYEIDLLHVHYAIPHAYAGYMAKQMLKAKGYDLPIVTTLHGTDITLVGNHPFYKPAVAFSIEASDAVTAVSHSLRKDTIEIFDIKKEIYVIPNFIDSSKYPDSFSDCDRSVMALPGEKIITHISNMRSVKRIGDVIEIFHRISEKIDAVLLMVGEGPEKDMAERLVRNKNIKYKVRFLGNSNEIDKILCFSDLFILPSESESFGLAALEAMINKVAVISTNTGGLPEVNLDGVSGLLSNVGDIDKMATDGLWLLEDDERLNKFKMQAFEVAKKYDIELILPLYEDIYQLTLNTKP